LLRLFEDVVFHIERGDLLIFDERPEVHVVLANDEDALARVVVGVRVLQGVEQARVPYASSVQ
jgi:hypothetical protein